MGRAADWSPVGMESDPTPGDPDRIQELSGKLQDFSDDVAEALDKVRSLSGEEGLAEFVGQTADAFTERVDGVPPNLEKLRDSYDLAAQALSQYWPKLADAQVDADRALDDAETALEELASAQAILDTATSSLTDAQQAVEEPDEGEVRSEVRRALDDAQTEHDSAQSAVDNAQARLDAARLLAQQAKEAWEDAARLCVQGLEEASDAGMQNKRWWEKAVDWVVDNWDTIVQVAQVIGTVVGIIALFVGGPLVFGILAVVAIIALADALIKYANGQGSLWDVGFALLDVIPGARLIGKGASLARTGLRSAARNVDTGPLLRQRSRLMNGRTDCGDPVDVATGELVMPAEDVDLPGVLPLVLERHHISSYGFGRWFGRSWSSTLDQRLVLDQAGARFFSADGMVLDYPAPLPDPEHPVMPVEGPRWGLAWDGQPGGTMTIHQPGSGHTLHFAPVPGLPGTELPLVAVTDRNTNRIAISYDEETGAPTEIAHTGGYRIGIATYGNRVTALHLISDPDEPLLLAYDYDDAGNLAEVYNSSGLPLRLEYDEHARLIRWEDRNNTWYRYEYDTDGRCTFSTGSDRALEYRYIYDTENHRTTATNSLGHATIYQFNAGYQLIAETDPLGATTSYELDRYDRPTAVTDPLGHTTHYTYDNAGRLTTITRPDGASIHTEYNDLGLPAQVTQADGTTWAYAYDTRGNPTTTLDPAGHRTRYTHNEHGAVTSITDALGNITHIRRDAAGLPTAVTDPLGETTHYHRDHFGRPVRIVDPLGAETHLSWTPDGKLLSRTDPLGAQEAWEWDDEGNLLAHTDANGGTTRYTYGPFDLPTSQTGPDGVRYTFTRDTELNLTGVTDPDGRTWRYTYDPAGRLIAETDFDGRTTTCTRDIAGQLTTLTNPAGQTVTYTHDALGQLTRKTTCEGQVTSYTYDLAGRVTHATSPGVDLTRAYDPLGNLLTETVNGRTLTLEYNPFGQRLSRTTPAGHHSTWTYDPTGQPLSLTTGGHTLTFDHDPVGREKACTLNGALSFTQTWDPAGRLTDQTLTTRGTTGPRTLHHRRYTYRPDGYPTTLTDPTGTTHYTLDPAGRVTNVTSPQGTETYTYDRTGNQTTAYWTAAEGQSATAGERTYTGTLLTRAGHLRYEYDSAGRVTLRQKTRLSHKPDTWRYIWDAEDRLTQTTTPDGVVWRYLYDPFGRRIAKQRLTADGDIAAQIEFTWHDTTVVEQTSTGPDTTHAVTTWDHNGLQPLTQIEQRDTDQQFYAIVTDLVGTPTHLIDQNGDTTWHTHTTLWGTTHTTGPAHTPLRFPGQYADEETGWHYNYHRHYDPHSARYTTPDPLGLTPAPNPYTYPHNPHTWADPLGLAPHSVNPPGGSGRPDGEMVLSGHGGFKLLTLFKRKVVVPEGTSVAMYSRHGKPISDRLGNAIETGNPVPVQVYGPGEKMPNYTLYPPDGLKIMGNPTTVNSPTRLSDMLSSNMGRVHWAACRSTSLF